MINNSQFNNFKIYNSIPLSLEIRGESDLINVIYQEDQVPIKVMKYDITTRDK